MRFVVPVFAKLNLTLRVTGRRDDGYHNLVSLMVRVPSCDVLYIEELDETCKHDVVTVTGLELPLEGENTVAKALRLAREAGFHGPYFEVKIVKNMLPGSGLGGGSGDASEMLRWLSTTSARNAMLPWMEIARHVGADVPFLLSGYQAAMVSGIGEKIKQLRRPEISGLVVFPKWGVGTKNAYSDLDSILKERKINYMNEQDARQELCEISDALSRGERVGLLPNDFALPLQARHPQYDEIFDIFEAMGCHGWGFTGSGAAAFAVYNGWVNFKSASKNWPSWVHQVLQFEAGIIPPTSD